MKKESLWSILKKDFFQRYDEETEKLIYEKECLEKRINRRISRRYKL